MPIATLVRILPVQRDGAFLLLAHCERCQKTVTHGGGFDPGRLHDFLGTRSAHCACEDYTLTDPDDVIGAFLASVA